MVLENLINNSAQGVTSIPLSSLASYGLRVDENFIRLIALHLGNILANRSFILSLLNILISSTSLLIFRPFLLIFIRGFIGLTLSALGIFWIEGLNTFKFLLD